MYAQIIAVPVGTEYTFEGHTLTVTETEAVVMGNTIYCTENQFRLIKLRVAFDQAIGEPKVVL